MTGFNPDQVVFPLDPSGKVLVSGSTFVAMIPSPENAAEEFGDLCAMHFRLHDYEHQNVDRAFFDLNVADCWNGRDRESTFLIYGYPTNLRNLEYAEPSYALSDVKVKQVVVSASYDRPSSAMGVHVIRMARSGEYSSDGLSGGPVFQLGEDAQGFFCGFAGVVLRGSATSDFLHFLDVRIMMQFMQRQAAEARA